MDIGKQQRVIIVELDTVETPDLQITEDSSSIFEEVELVGDWPLPLDMDPEPVS